MSEPTLICSAPALADSAQSIALYSHYAVVIAGVAVGGVMIMRSRVQEKLPHILGAIAAFGIALGALYSQWEFNQYLYQCREMAVNAVSIRVGAWSLWSILLLVALAFTPGFRFKRIKKQALLPLILFAVAAFTTATFGVYLATEIMTVTPTIKEVEDVAGNLLALQEKRSAVALGSMALFGTLSLVSTLLLGATFFFSQFKKVEKRSEENHQIRTGIMTMIAIGVPAIAYGAGAFLVSSPNQGIDKAILLFSCAEVVGLFFLLCATMSLLGIPANFPRPKKVEPAAAPVAPTPFTPADEQQAYAQAYAQQLYAQQQAYAQYYAQQQAVAAGQQVPQQAQAPHVAPSGAQPQADPAAIAAYQQQQAQYYAQQQAYAAYQQQQQAYAQAHAQPSQAYARPEGAFQQQPRPVAPSVVPTPVPGVRKVVSPTPAATVRGVKKIGGVRQIKKIR